MRFAPDTNPDTEALLQAKRYACTVDESYDGFTVVYTNYRPYTALVAIHKHTDDVGYGCAIGNDIIGDDLIVCRACGAQQLRTTNDDDY